jgi:hypothetical protein
MSRSNEATKPGGKPLRWSVGTRLAGASWQAPARRINRRAGALGWSAYSDDVTEQKYPVLLEYAKASFERIKQRLRHLCALARVKRVLNGYTLASDLDRQFGDVLVGLRKMLLSMIHGFARTLAGSFTTWRPAPVWGAAAAPLVACSDVIGSSVTDILWQIF